MTYLWVAERNSSGEVFLGSDVVEVVLKNPTEVFLGVVTAKEDGGGVPIVRDVGFVIEGEGVLPNLICPRAVLIKEDRGVRDELGLVIGLVDAVDVNEVEVVVVGIFAGSCNLVFGPVEVWMASEGLDFYIAIGKDRCGGLEGEYIITHRHFFLVEVHNLSMQKLGKSLALEGKGELFSERALAGGEGL